MLSGGKVGSMRVRPIALALSSLLLLATGLVIVLVALATGPGPDGAPLGVNDHGVSPCVAGAERDLLSVSALQCWFQARQGRWRIVSSVPTQGVLLVEVEAAEIDDAEEIAERFVASERGQYLEIMVYVQAEWAGPSTRIRRIHWTRRGGFETLEFNSSPAS